jgi:hypothetical protein
MIFLNRQTAPAAWKVIGSTGSIDSSYSAKAIAAAWSVALAVSSLNDLNDRPALKPRTMGSRAKIH